MLKNHIAESYLYGYVPNLTDLLWTDETDYSEQRVKATDYVYNSMIQRNYKPKELMPELILRASGTVLSYPTDTTETTTGVLDTINRMRIVIDNITITTSGKTITLQGSNDNTTFYTIQNITVPINTTSTSVVFYDSYKYYRLTTALTSGTIDYRAYIVETIYDELFSYKWLQYILMSVRRQGEDQFDLLIRDFDNMYNDILNNVKLYIDQNADGIPDAVTTTKEITLTR